MQLPSRIEFIEVGTRDGLQSARADVSTDDKVRLVDALAQTGLPRIEVTSFVSPKAVPQLADGEEVYRRVRKDTPARYRVLIPNLRGLERALAVGATNVLVNVGATDGFNRANLNRTVEETLSEIAQVVARARPAGVVVDASLSVAFGCPYEGPVRSEERRVGKECRRLCRSRWSPYH
jgi:hydroxymethylglutaryl-CoA lyase